MAAVILANDISDNENGYLNTGWFRIDGENQEGDRTSKTLTGEYRLSLAITCYI